MKLLTKILALLTVSLALVGCDKRTQVQGFYSFYVPSSNYRVGQVWAIYTKPAKIVIQLQTPVPDEKILTSSDFNLSSKDTSKLVANASVGLQEELSAKLGVSRSKIVAQEYKNAKVVEVEMVYLFEALKSHLVANPSTAEYLRSLLTTKPKTKLDVATHILVADIVFTVDKSLVAAAGAELPKIIEGMDIGLSLASESSGEYKFEGKALAVAYHSDPDFIKRCLDLVK